MWKLLSRVRNVFASPAETPRVVPDLHKGPVFRKLTMPDGRVITYMREDAFQRALDRVPKDK